MRRLNSTRLPPACAYLNRSCHHRASIPRQAPPPRACLRILHVYRNNRAGERGKQKEREGTRAKPASSFLSLLNLLPASVPLWSNGENRGNGEKKEKGRGHAAGFLQKYSKSSLTFTSIQKKSREKMGETKTFKKGTNLLCIRHLISSAILYPLTSVLMKTSFGNRITSHCLSLAIGGDLKRFIVQRRSAS